MNILGGGFISVINYTAGGGIIGTEDPLLTESSNDILTESFDLLEYEI